MMAGLVLMAAANAGVLLGSSAILRRIRTGRPSTDLVLFLLVRLALISSGVLAAGLTRTVSPLGLALPAILCLVGLLATGEHRRLPSLKWPAVGPWLTVFAAIIGVRLLLQVWFFTPHLGDPLAYHLPKIAEWIQARGFTREMGVHTHVPFPAGFELIETWWVVFLKHDVLIEFAGVEFLILAFAAVRALAERYGTSERGAFIAALLFVLVPGLHLSTTSCLNDTPAAALVVATLALVACRVHPLLLLMAAGLGVGVKPTYGFALPGMILLAWLNRKQAASPAPGRGFACTLSLLGAFAGGFWYVRNLIWFGNPFHPLGSPNLEDPTPVQFGARLSSLGDNLLDLANVRIYDHAALYGPNVDHMAGWGCAAFACGLVGLVVVLKDRPEMRGLAGAFCLSLASTLTLVQNDPWCLKYVFFFPALLSVTAVQLAERLPECRPILAGAILLSFLGTCFSYDLRPQHVRVLAAQPWRERTAARFAYGEVTMEVPDSRIGYFGAPTGAAYLLYRPDFSRQVVYLRSSSFEAFLEDAGHAQVRTVFAPQAGPAQKRILDEGVRLGRLRLLSGCFYALR
jgi:hypothetical protein